MAHCPLSHEEGKTMAPPASAARALHDILARVENGIGEPHKSGYHSWGAVAGATVGSNDFAAYHGEVVGLFSETLEGLSTLAPDAQTRYGAYLSEWWDALVRPRIDWATEGRTIIEDPALHMLGALADVMEARASVSPPTSPRATEILQKAISLLVHEVESDTELPFTVREQILADLRHVLWLLENVSTFGVDHAVAAVEKVTGKVLSVATVSRSERIRKVAIGLTAALAMAATVTTSVDTIATNIKHTFGVEASQPRDGEDVVQNVVVKVYNVATPKELPPGKEDVASQDDDGTVVAEVVEDEGATG